MDLIENHTLGMAFIFLYLIYLVKGMENRFFSSGIINRPPFQTSLELYTNHLLVQYVFHDPEELFI